MNAIDNETKYVLITSGTGAIGIEILVAKMAPIRACPSDPMLIKFPLNAKTTENASNIKGVKRTNDSIMLYFLPRLPINIDLNASKGLAPVNKIKKELIIIPTKKDKRYETNLTSCSVKRSLISFSHQLKSEYRLHFCKIPTMYSMAFSGHIEAHNLH